MEGKKLTNLTLSEPRFGQSSSSVEYQMESTADSYRQFQTRGHSDRSTYNKRVTNQNKRAEHTVGVVS